MPNSDGTNTGTNVPEEKRHPKGFFVTPGLLPDVLRFEEHYEVSLKNAREQNGKRPTPILILGPTGTGKSLFLDMFVSLDKREQEKLKAVWKEPVWANCAHFGGQQSDPNIARAELFGTEIDVKGKDSRYNVNVPIGLLKKADGAPLILEEIGELPLEVQAMLLTFIEDGYFRKVGGIDKCYSSARIIGATNRESALRRDFRYRFSPFKITPIHRRRLDVLYYLGEKFPDVVQELRPFEVMALLAYHWPGSVREIERIGGLLQREHSQLAKAKMTASELRGESPSHFFTFDEEDTALNVRKIFSLYRDLENHDEKNLKSLRSILKNKGLDLDIMNDSQPFKKFSKEKLDTAQPDYPYPTDLVWDHTMRYALEYSREEIKTNFNLPVLFRNKEFDEAFEGLKHFCHYFLQSLKTEKDLLDVNTGAPDAFTWREGWADSSELLNLEKRVFKFLARIDLPPNLEQIPRNYYERNSLWHTLLKANSSNSFLQSLLPEFKAEAETKKQDLDIASMTQEELLILQCEKQIEKAGTIKGAAALAGVNYHTYWAQYKRLKQRT